MGRVASLILVSVVVVLIALHVSGRADARPAAAEAAAVPAARWEYAIVPYADLVDDDFAFRGREEEFARMQARMNQLGRDRWELVTKDETMLVFKRRLDVR